MNFYNENDSFAAAWLRELIKAGHIAPGVVDERSVEDIAPDELRQYTQCHFFAGIGVWSYSLRQAGWPDDRPVWTGSCPCQPFSTAGKRGGVADERHLWPAWFHLLEQCRPSVVFGEQVDAGIRQGWLDLVQTDLEAIGYTVGPVSLPACGFGAPHIRQRLYFVADTGYVQRPPRTEGLQHQSQTSIGRRPTGNGATNGFWHPADWLPCRDGKARPVEPGTRPLAPRITNHVGRLRGYGNAIVAPVAEAFIRAYLERE
jgi:DNA (cytosine-5)-methyltransferase 1